MQKAGRRSAAAAWILPLAVVGPAIYMLSPTGADPDLWGHVRFGQLMLATGDVTRAEPFSYLAETWINHEWLAEVAFALAFRGGGAAGLVALKVTLGLLLVALTYLFLLRRRLHPLAAVAVALGIVPYLAVGLSVRPHLFTFVGFLILLILLAEAEEDGRRWLLPVPLLFAVWVNLHGGVLAGLGVLAVWSGWHVAEALLSGRLPAGGRARGFGLAAGAAAVAGLAATLITPYGHRLLLFLLRTATVPRPDITEWYPVEPTAPEGLAYLALVGLSGWILLGTRRKRRPALLAVLAVVAVLPLMASRHLPLFGLAAAVVVGPHVGSALRSAFPGLTERTPGEPAARASGREMALAAALAGAVSLAAIAGSVPSFRCIGFGPPLDPYPARAVAVLERSGVEAKLAVIFDWGQYAIWHLGPEVQVGMDGRRETVYPDSVRRDYLRFYYGTGDWDAFLANPDADLVLVARGLPPDNLLSLDEAWEAAYQDRAAVLYARAGSDRAGAIARTTPPDLPPDGAGLCFP